MSNASQVVTKLYHTVVEDVINNVKEAFLDEGVDEQVLQELKQLWENKINASKALEPPPSDNEILLAPGLSQNMMMLPQSVQGAQSQRSQQSSQQRPTQASQQIQGGQTFQPSGASGTTTLSLPSGLFQQQLAAIGAGGQQQLAAIGAGGQIQNITVQQTGTGQYITLAGLTPQQLPQFQQQQQQQQQQPGQPRLAPHITPQMLQQQQQHQRIQLTQQGQPPKLIQAAQLLRPGQTRHPSQAAQQALQNIVQLDGPGDSSSSDDDDDDLDDDKEEEEEKDEEHEEDGQGEEEEPLNSDDDVSEEDPNELFDSENVVVCQYDKINRNKNKWKFYLKDGIMSLNGRDFVFQKATGDSEW